MSKKIGITDERIEELALEVQTYLASNPMHPKLTVQQAIRIAATEAYAMGVRKGRKEALAALSGKNKNQADAVNH